MRQLMQNIATRGEYSGSDRLSRLHMFMTYGSTYLDQLYKVIHSQLRIIYT